MTPRPTASTRATVRPGLSAAAQVVAAQVAAALAAGLVLALAMLPATAGAAQAHARFLASDPANGAKLTAAPASIKLTFNEDVLPGSAKLRVDGPAGAAAVGAIVIRTTTVAAAMPPDLGSGTYTVTWRVTSADGHPISGAFRYTLTLPATATTASSASPTPTSPTPTSPSSTDASAATSAAASTPAAPSASPSLDTTPVTPVASTTDSGATPLVVGALAVTLLVAGGLWWRRSRS